MKTELLKLWKEYLDHCGKDPIQPVFPSFEGFMAWIEQTEKM